MSGETVFGRRPETKTTGSDSRIPKSFTSVRSASSKPSWEHGDASFARVSRDLEDIVSVLEKRTPLFLFDRCDLDLVRTTAVSNGREQTNAAQ